jgi:signal transduction histidine kinase
MWWPEGESWPPHRPPNLRALHGLRGFFFWRVAGLFLFLLVAGAASCALTLWLAGWLGTPGALSQPLAWVAIPAGMLLLAVLARGWRVVALPIGDLIDAAGRVQAGDYSVRLAGHGPRELRSLARAFNAMAERLQQDQLQRRDLLADVTHELRTPVAVIQGNLEGLLDGVYPADAEHLAPVLDETRVLSRLIDDLRTLALAESGALVLHTEPTDLAVLAGEVAASFRAHADPSGPVMAVKIPADLPLLEIDPLRIREVLVNLTVNALRHTSHGGRVTLSASADRARGQVTVTVQDTGTGIAPADLPHIFDRFYKSRDSEGSGLGLAIAKNLVAAHGGEISAESKVGAGTTLRFTLPMGTQS